MGAYTSRQTRPGTIIKGNPRGLYGAIDVFLIRLCHVEHDLLCTRIDNVECLSRRGVDKVAIDHQLRDRAKDRIVNIRVTLGLTFLSSCGMLGVIKGGLKRQ